MRDPTLLVCRAPHRLGDVPRFAGRTCGQRITRAPVPCEPTGRVLPGLDATLDETMISVWCKQCRAWTEYRVQWDRVGGLPRVA